MRYQLQYPSGHRKILWSQLCDPVAVVRWLRFRRRRWLFKPFFLLQNFALIGRLNCNTITEGIKKPHYHRGPKEK
jgi:hypothetical protein